MKRIVSGVTYDTSTATAVARWDCEADDNRPASEIHMLYQTRKGAFFLHVHKSWAVQDSVGQWAERESDAFEPMTNEAANKWILEGDVEILTEGVFPEPLEAAPETTAGATIYLRVPELLKRRIEKSAQKADQSVNVWAMRCLESCLKSPAE